MLRFLKQWFQNRTNKALKKQHIASFPPILEQLKNQIFLGEQLFVERLQNQIQVESEELKEIPNAQRRLRGKSLNDYVENFANAKDGMKISYASGDYILQPIATAFSMHYSTMSRAGNQK